jgi:hypothetical protein
LDRTFYQAYLVTVADPLEFSPNLRYIADILELCGLAHGELALVEVELADGATVSAVADGANANCIDQTAESLNRVIVGATIVRNVPMCMQTDNVSCYSPPPYLDGRCALEGCSSVWLC